MGGSEWSVQSEASACFPALPFSRINIIVPHIYLVISWLWVVRKGTETIILLKFVENYDGT